MNGIRLFFKSAKGSVFSSLTLFVVLGAVLLTLNYTLSQYLYIRRAGEMFENAGLPAVCTSSTPRPTTPKGRKRWTHASNRCGKAAKWKS